MEVQVTGHTREGLLSEAGKDFPEGMTFVLGWEGINDIVSSQEVGLSIRMLSEL